ncbi:methyl-accepting chemotaxis protein [Rheinheimera marina]|uniref:Methyl-accepting chemotaxis protein n=1 Tax=Rheinheimera marina TaxID=1774958 RepID=A0ABV9JPT8_9GAMM
MHTALENLSIRIKLLGGFGLVLLILVFISVLSYQSLEGLSARFELTTKVSAANLLISEARQQEKNFLLRKDITYYQAAQDLSNKAKQQAEESLPLFTTEESAKLIRELLTELDAYQQLLTRIKEVVNQGDTANLDGLETQMTKAARAADQAGTQSVERQLDTMRAEVKAKEQLIIACALAALLIGVMAALVITQMVVSPIQQVVKVAENIATGDLTANLPTNRLDEPGQLMRSMQKMSMNLRTLIEHLSTGITQLAAATEEMAAISEQNSAGVRQQKEETEQVATAMNEMATTVQDVAQNAEQASSYATESAQQASQGTTVVQQTTQQIKALAHEVTTSVQAIVELKDQSNTIGAVLDVIKNVADQTNLLALNAAIEAARAGEAGRGFSVVAEEVRALAFRTQESTGQIEQLISSLQHKAEAAVSTMQRSSDLAEQTLGSADNAGEAITAITRAVGSIQSMNQQIAAAALQQATVAEQINRSIFSIRDVAEQSSIASEQTALASADLSRPGTELQQMAAQFKVA